MELNSSTSYSWNVVSKSHIYADNKFEPLREEMDDIGISLNCASKKEHVPDIEQFNRTTRERVRSSWAAMHFKRIYKLMIVYLLATAIFLRNVFPPPQPGTVLSNTKGPE